MSRTGLVLDIDKLADKLTVCLNAFIGGTVQWHGAAARLCPHLALVRYTHTLLCLLMWLLQTKWLIALDLMATVLALVGGAAVAAIR